MTLAFGEPSIVRYTNVCGCMCVTRISVYMYMHTVVVQITRAYIGTLGCIVLHPGRKELPLYVPHLTSSTVNSSARTIANSTWIELQLTSDTEEATKNGQLLFALAMSRRTTLSLSFSLSRFYTQI